MVIQFTESYVLCNGMPVMKSGKTIINSGRMLPRASKQTTLSNDGLYVRTVCIIIVACRKSKRDWCLRLRFHQDSDI